MEQSASNANRPSTPVNRRPRFDFSFTGLIYSAMMMFMGLAAVNLQASLLFGVFGLMIGILIASERMSKVVLRKLDVRRLLPDQATVGRPALIHYSIVNTKRIWASLSVTIAEIDGVESFRRQPHAYLLHVAPRNSAAISCEVTPKRRGMTTLDRYQLLTSFPFGFIKRGLVRRQRDTMLVFPPIGRVDKMLLSQFRSAETSGNSLRPMLQGNDEFYGLRDYRAGESPRMIYWKRTAKTGKLVSREMTRASPPRIVVVVDTFNPEASADRAAEIELSIAQAASLIEASIEAGLAVGLTVRAEQWEIIAPNRGKRHKRELLTLLAKLPAGTRQHIDDAHTALAQAASVANALTTLVLMTGGVDSRIASGSRRGAGMMIGCRSSEAAHWFEFDPSIDFATAGPFEVPEPRLRGRRGFAIMRRGENN
jgi:uncharacterized protein (DUF58 family)